MNKFIYKQIGSSQKYATRLLQFTALARSVGRWQASILLEFKILVFIELLSLDQSKGKIITKGQTGFCAP